MTHVTQRKDNSRTKDATKRRSGGEGWREEEGAGKTQKPNYDLFLGFGALPTETEREGERGLAKHRYIDT